MADWKGVRKGEYELGSREDREKSSKVHRNLRSRSSTPGSNFQLKHSAHMKRKRRESSSSHFKRKRRSSSRSRSRSSSVDMKDKSQPRVRSKEWKKGKGGCNSSEGSDNECTRRHVTRTTRSEWSSERLKHKHRKRKRRYSSPSSDSSSDSDSSDSYSSESSVRQRRKKKHLKREKHSHRLHKKSERKKHKLKSKRKRSSKMGSGRVITSAEAGIEGPHALPANPKQQDQSVVQSVVPISGKTVKMRGPMTKEEWEKQQSVVRRVYDPDTGRHRLVKGDGEIIEEIVSREQQKAINKQATLGDGLSFRAGLSKLL